MNSNENLPPMVVARLMKDIRALAKQPPEGITVLFNEENIANISADIDGPVGTPFEGGVFRVKLVLTSDFPNSPPKGFFVTKIFHPNVSASGEICVNTLKKDWKSEHGLDHILMVIRCLLIFPNPDSALNEEAGKLLQEDYDDYARRAAMFTRIHAKPRKVDAGTVSLDAAVAATGEAKKPSGSDDAPAAAAAPVAAAAAAAGGKGVAASPAKKLKAKEKEKVQGKEKSKSLKRL